jgi:hypothetical protein
MPPFINTSVFWLAIIAICCIVFLLFGFNWVS